MSTVKIAGVANDQQRTEDWKLSRMGRFSCSQSYRLMTDPKAKADKDAGNLSDRAVTYVEECISEKLTGMQAKDEFVSKDMQWGIDNEPIAKQIYEAVFECKVIDSGYISANDNYGGSPDGLVNEDGGIEIKCPSRPTHVKYCRIKTLDQFRDSVQKQGYYWQVIGYLLVTGRKWFDFVSYNPFFPPANQLSRYRILREEVEPDIEALRSRVIRANTELNRILTEELKIK